MVKYENECVGCPKELGCLGNTCPNRNVPHHYCDKCGDETDLYEFDDSELCGSCVLDSLKKVNA